MATTIHPGGATAGYLHAFTHADGAEYQSILLDWGFAHATLGGWIPVDLEFDAWTDVEGVAALRAFAADPRAALAVPGMRSSGSESIELQVTELTPDRQGPWTGRGERRLVTHHVRLLATLGGPAVKLSVYRDCVRAGLTDLVGAVIDGRRPLVDGLDACESLATALAAQRSADSGHTVEMDRIEIGGRR